MTKYDIHYFNKIYKKWAFWYSHKNYVEAKREFDLFKTTVKPDMKVTLTKTTEDVIEEADGEFKAE